MGLDLVELTIRVEETFGIQAFYSLRREFAQQLSIPRRQFVLDTNLKQILPEERSTEAWTDIRSSLGVKRWPEIGNSWLAFLTPRVQSVRELVDFMVTSVPVNSRRCGLIDGVCTHVARHN